MYSFLKDVLLEKQMLKKYKLVVSGFLEFILLSPSSSWPPPNLKHPWEKRMEIYLELTLKHIVKASTLESYELQFDSLFFTHSLND